MCCDNLLLDVRSIFTKHKTPLSMLGGIFHSRSQTQEKEKEQSSGSKSRGSKKRTNNSSSSSTSIPATSNIARTQSNHHHHHHKSNNSHNNSKSNAKNDHTTSNNNNLGGGSLSISAATASNVVHASTIDGVNTHSNTTITTTSASGTQPTIQTQSTIVKLSPAPASTGSARTSSPIVNVTLMKKFRDEPSTSRTPDMTASSNASSSGGLKFAFEPQSSQVAPPMPSGLMINTQAFHHMKDSPPSSPSGSEASARKRRKTPQQSPHGNTFEVKRDHRDEKEKETKTLQNGAIPTAYPTHHMLGNQLNPSSIAAKSMTETLNMEIEAHSIYTTEPQSNLIGPQYPGRKDSVS